MDIALPPDAKFRVFYVGPADREGRPERNVVFEHVGTDLLSYVLGSMRKTATGSPLRVVIERELEVSTEAMQGKAAGDERSDNGLNLRLLWCPPGNFRTSLSMCQLDPKDQATRTPLKIALTCGFWIGKYAVTQAEWNQLSAPAEATDSGLEPKTLAEANACAASAGFSDRLPLPRAPWRGHEGAVAGGDLPAAHISWDNAMAFGASLTELERESGRLPADWEFTLPTEAQWELCHWAL